MRKSVIERVSREASSIASNLTTPIKVTDWRLVIKAVSAILISPPSPPSLPFYTFLAQPILHAIGHARSDTIGEGSTKSDFVRSGHGRLD